MKAQILAEHGPHARIISAEKVTQGGIGGFLARRYVEVVVDVPPRVAARHVRVDSAARMGIASLLDDADAAEGGARDAFPELELSTNAVGFEAVVAELTTRAGLGAGATFALPQPTVPYRMPPTAPGDLTLFIGLGDDTLRAARGVASLLGIDVELRAGGTVGLEHSDAIRDRRSAASARADAVGARHAVFVAYGLDPAVDATVVLQAIAADQVWAVVDAGRKHDDTARWLGDIVTVVAVERLAIVGAHRTATPETVDALGIPIGWRETATDGWQVR